MSDTLELFHSACQVYGNKRWLQVVVVYFIMLLISISGNQASDFSESALAAAVASSPLDSVTDTPSVMATSPS